MRGRKQELLWSAWSSARKIFEQWLSKQGPESKKHSASVNDASELADSIDGILTSGQAHACRKGCSHCCDMRVLVTAPEVFAITEYIRSTRSNEDIAETRKMVSKAAQAVSSMSEVERRSAEISCPLLVESKCSVYEVRPLECRGYCTYSENSCIEFLKSSQDYNQQLDTSRYSIYKNIQAGAIAALHEAGHRFEVMDLISALDIALTSDDLQERWHQGEDVFGSILLNEGDFDSKGLLPWTDYFS